MPRASPRPAGVDAIFHTAAYFRESYRGGSHWPRSSRGRRDASLIALALTTGVRRFLHASSIGTLAVRRRDGRPVDETLPEDAAATGNDYFRSKILADAAVTEGARAHPEFFAAFVLPGFMNGPGDAGPTAAGQMTPTSRPPPAGDRRRAPSARRRARRRARLRRGGSPRRARCALRRRRPPPAPPRRLHLLARVTGVPAPDAPDPVPTSASSPRATKRGRVSRVGRC